jgi:hypothetical protein
MKLSPTFKLIDGVWHLTYFKDLKKGDIIKVFNDRPDPDNPDGPVDFQELPSRTCVSEPYITTPEGKYFVGGVIPEGVGDKIWGIEVDQLGEKDDNGS